MATLNEKNCSVDNDSGAVFFHKSPELLEIIKLRQDIKDLDKKMSEILEILKRGSDENGSEMGKR